MSPAETLFRYRCEACGEAFIIPNPPPDKEIWTCPWCVVTGVWLDEEPVDLLKPTLKEAEE